MKKLIIAVALVFTSAVYSFANNGEVDPQVISSFNKEFPGAQVNTLIERAGYYEISYTLEGKTLFAFYSKSCELICVIRHIVSTDLPSELQWDIKRTYSGFWITDLFELTSSEQTKYFINLQNAKTRFILHSDEQNNWEVFRSY